MSSRRLTAALVALLVLVACAGAGSNSDEPRAAPSIRDLRTEDMTGPYVSVAVDNHFHDVHPEDRIEIAEDRPFIVKNQGSNRHNVSVVGTDIDEDLEPGEQFAIRPVGKLGLGPQVFICKLHAAQGMTGQFTVVEAP